MSVEGWTAKQLGEVCGITIGGTPSRTNPIYWDVDKSTQNIWVSIKDICKKYITETTEYLTEEGIKNSNVKKLEKGTILLSFKLTIGRVAIAGKDLYTNEAIAGLKIRGISPDFLYFGLQQWDLLQNVDQAIKGATLNKEKLKKIKFDCPESIEEQEKIAEVLSTIDNAIAQTEALIAKQQRIKTGLMQDLLTKGIDENGNIRSEETHEFKDSAIGRIPVEWNAITLKDVGTWLSGGTPSKAEKSYWGSVVPWVCPKDMKVFDIETTSTMLTNKGVLAGSRIAPTESVFIVVRGMILAHTLPVCFATKKMAFNQDVKAIVANEMIRGRYLAYWLYSNTSRLLKIVTTSTHGTKRFDTNELHEISMGIPPKMEQQQIIYLLDKAQSDIGLLREYFFKLKAIKTGLMQDLLTGKVRVTSLLENSGGTNP